MKKYSFQNDYEFNDFMEFVQNALDRDQYEVSNIFEVTVWSNPSTLRFLKNVRKNILKR